MLLGNVLQPAVQYAGQQQQAPVNLPPTLNNFEIEYLFSSIKGLARDKVTNQWLEIMLNQDSDERKTLIDKINKLYAAAPWIDVLTLLRTSIANLSRPNYADPLFQATQASNAPDKAYWDFEKVNGWHSSIIKSIDDEITKTKSMNEEIRTILTPLLDREMTNRGIKDLAQEMSNVSDYRDKETNYMFSDFFAMSSIITNAKNAATKPITELPSIVDKASFLRQLNIEITKSMSGGVNSLKSALNYAIGQLVQRELSQLVPNDVSLRDARRYAANSSLITLDVFETLLPGAKNILNLRKVLWSEVRDDINFEASPTNPTSSGTLKMNLLYKTTFLSKIQDGELEIYKHDFLATNIVSPLEKAASLLADAIKKDGNTANKTVTEKDLITILGQVQNIRDILNIIRLNSKLSITLDQFNALTGSNVTVDYSAISQSSHTTFESKFIVQIDQNNKLIFDAYVAETDSQKNVETKRVTETTFDSLLNSSVYYVPYISMISEQLSQFQINKRIWVQELIDNNFQPISPLSLDYLRGKSNINDLISAYTTKLNQIDPTLINRFTLDVNFFLKDNHYNVELNVQDLDVDANNQSQPEYQYKYGIPYETIYSKDNVSNFLSKPFLSSFASNNKLGVLLSTLQSQVDDATFNNPNIGYKPTDAQIQRLFVLGDNLTDIVTWSDLLKNLLKDGIISVDWSSFITKEDAKASGVTFIYQDDLTGNQIKGLIFTFTLDLYSINDNSKINNNQIRIFIPLDNSEASMDSKLAASQEVHDKSSEIISSIDDTHLRKILGEEKVKEIVDKIQNEYVKGFDDLIFNNKISELQLNIAKERTLQKISQLLDDYKGNISKSEILAKYSDIFGGNIPDDILKAILANLDVFANLLDLNPSIELIKQIAGNKNLLDILGKMNTKAMETFFNSLTGIENNTKYAYFGTSVALAAVGSVGGASAVSSYLVARKSAKITKTKLKFKGNKLLLSITSLFSVGSVLSSVAMMIYFFVEKGGF